MNYNICNLIYWYNLVCITSNVIKYYVILYIIFTLGKKPLKLLWVLIQNLQCLLDKRIKLIFYSET